MLACAPKQERAARVSRSGSPASPGLEAARSPDDASVAGTCGHLNPPDYRTTLETRLHQLQDRSQRPRKRGHSTARSAWGYADAMPMPKRASVDDFFAQLNDIQRPHLEALRELSLDADPAAREELKWNLPVYVRGKKTSLWMLQNFKNHCSLRFPPPFFATQKAAVEAAGYEAGEGFIKLSYERELPIELLEALLQARVEEYAATGAGWNDR